MDVDMSYYYEAGKHISQHWNINEIEQIAVKEEPSSMIYKALSEIKSEHLVSHSQFSSVLFVHI